DGSIHVLAFRGEAHQPTALQPIQLTGVCWDITERKQAEDALRQASKDILDLYNVAPCGYHSVNADGTIIAINDTELQWLGYTREEVVGKRRLREFLTPDSQKVFEERFPIFK